MDFFAKPLAAMTIEDINWIIENQIREGSDLEFKALPSEHGEKGTIWIKPNGAVTREGKEALLKELVAFANASGGTLIFGISDKGSRAAGITPVPEVESCADRLKLICRDSVEPAIPQIEIRGIPISERDGTGVIVFRVKGQSPMGPHRSNADKEFYVRRNDRSDPMTVDEIRRYSINLQNRLSSIETRFETQSQALFRKTTANGMLLADRLQRKSKYYEVEYWMTFSAHTASLSKNFVLQGYGNHSFRGLGQIPNDSYVFPTLPVSSRMAYNDVCTILDKDFCDYAGYKGQRSNLMFDFAPALKSIDAEFNAPA